jgi:3-isopropylmalate/(R)-2-methylmalate dehydratase small subunit
LVPGFTTHTGKIAVIPDDNIDTDRIIPARFLTRVTRSGYGELLFCDVRGTDFPLDRPEAEGSTILVTGSNFGCGSSREHAVWAIQQAGYQAVIAKRTATSAGFSDIFRGNAANCGLLLIELDEADHRRLSEAGSGAEATIDLPAQKIYVNGHTVYFDINQGLKAALVEGLDLIGTTLQHSAAIDAFEARSETFVPSREVVTGTV